MTRLTTARSATTATLPLRGKAQAATHVHRMLAADDEQALVRARSAAASLLLRQQGNGATVGIEFHSLRYAAATRPTDPPMPARCLGRFTKD
jgi:hypothetical protein